MKTTIQTTNHVRRHHGNILKALLPILAAGALASCGSQSVAISRSEPVAVPASAPVRIWHQMPPELPRGVADEEPTNGWEGMWGGIPIEFDDVKDAEGMIPLLQITKPL